MTDDLPRYAPECPFPAYAFAPGRPHPTRDPQGHSYGAPEPEIEPDWRRSRAFRFGVDLLPQRFVAEGLVEAFRRAKDLRHPHLVRLGELGEHEGVAFVTWEDFDGRPLRELLQEYELRSGGNIELSVIDPEPFSVQTLWVRNAMCSIQRIVSWLGM